MSARAVAVALICLAACGGKKASSGHRITVAAAADLQLAFEEIAQGFQKKTGIEVTVSPGSSGILAQQIDQGADFDVFAAANAAYVDDVIAKGSCDGATRQSYARGRIVVWTAGDPPARLADLADPKYKQIAIANPEHAPYGKAAKQALEKVGIWDKVKDRIVQGENVQQAMQFARSGNVDAAIVALSLTVESKGGASLPIDPSLYDPLDQQMVVCGKGEAAGAAKQFIDYVMSPEGHEIMTRYGFLQPGESPPSPSGAGGTGGGARRGPPPIDRGAVDTLLAAWVAAQTQGNFDAYQGLYADRFGGVKRVGARTWRFDRKGWLADRKKMFAAPMKVTADDPQVTLSGDAAIVRFRQSFAQGSFADTGDKQLVVVAGPGGARIAHEEMLASTVTAGPGSAQALDLPLLSDGKTWLVVGNGDQVTTVGAATIGNGGTGFDFSVRQQVSASGATAKLVGQTATLYPSGVTCPVAGLARLTVLTPHFSVLAAWHGDTDGDGTPESPALAGDALAQAILGGGGASYLVADVSGCAVGKDDVVGTIGATAPAWPEVKDDALAKQALAALAALPDYAAIQTDYEQNYGGKGAWTDADNGSVTESAYKSPDGKDELVVVGARAGTGCGDFSGALVEVFHLGAGGKLEAAGALDGGLFADAPTAVLDANKDGHPELAGHASLAAWNGKTYATVTTLDLGFRDCGC